MLDSRMLESIKLFEYWKGTFIPFIPINAFFNANQCNLTSKRVIQPSNLPFRLRGASEDARSGCSDGNHRGVDTAKMVLKCGGAYYLRNSTISYFVFLYHPILSLRSLTFVVNLFSLCHLFREPENYNSPNNISHLRTSACISYKWQSF